MKKKGPSSNTKGKGSVGGPGKQLPTTKVKPSTKVRTSGRGS